MSIRIILCLAALAIAVSTDGAAQEARYLSALETMLSTVNAGDAAGYAALYANDAIITIYGTGEIKGRAAIERHEVDLLRQFPGTRLAFFDVWQTGGPSVVAHYAVLGRATSGQQMGHEGLLFFRFNASGHIQEEHRYLDSLTPMIQLGALPGAAARAFPRLPDRLTPHAAGASSVQQANAAIATRVLKALHDGRATAFLSDLADNATVDEVMTPCPFARRSEAVDWLKSWSTNSRLELMTTHAVGNFVLVEARLNGTLTGPIGRLTATNKPYAVHRAFIVQVTQGKVTRLSALTNGRELAEPSGQWPLQ
jgi:ketosteroid isomerase-like protein